jgi:hypothetical protein
MVFALGLTLILNQGQVPFLSRIDIKKGTFSWIRVGERR